MIMQALFMSAATPISSMAASWNTVAIGGIYCEWSAMLWGRTSTSVRSLFKATCTTGIQAGALELQYLVDMLCVAAR